MADDNLPTPEPDVERRLNLLLHESQQARDDERYLNSQFPVLITVALTLISSLAALYATTYAKEGPPPTAGELIAVPMWVYMGAPMLPIVLMSYLVIIGAVGTLRSYYLRVMELRIHKLTDQRKEELPIPSWVHIELEATGQTRSRGWERLNWLAIYLIMSLMLLGCIVALGFKIPIMRYRVFSLAVNGILMIIPVAAGAVNASSGARLWKQALDGVPARLDRTDGNFRSHSIPGERSLGSFLFLPRNQEELMKALFIPICFVVGRWLAPGLPPLDSGMVWHCVGFLFVFEFLIYQARYLINDVRDRLRDSKTPDAKPRFPSSWTEKNESFALKVAFASFLTRLLIAGLLVGCILPWKNSWWVWHVAFLATVGIIAELYETVRSKCKAAEHTGPRTAWTIALVAVVGLGYGLRSIVGFWLAGGADPTAFVLLALGGSLFGSTLIALGWALESTRGPAAILKAGKAHLEFFWRLVSRNGEIPVSTEDRVLAGWQSWITPWSVPAILATAALAAFVLFLLRNYLSAGQSVLIAAGAVGIAALAGVTPVTATFFLTGVNLIGVAGALLYSSVGPTESVIAALVAAFPLISTSAFRTMRFKDLPGFTEKIMKVIFKGVSSLYDLFARAR